MLSRHFIRTMVFLYLVCMNSLASADSFFVNVRNGHVDLQADEASLLHILEKIEVQTDIRMWFYISEDFRVTGALENVPLEDALHSLLRNLNYSVIYQGKGEEGDVISSVTAIEKLHKTDNKSVYVGGSRNVDAQHLPEKERRIMVIGIDLPGRLPLYNKTPVEDNPMVSINGIDPLMRFDGKRPDFLQAIPGE